MTKTLRPFLSIYHGSIKFRIGFIILSVFILVAVFSPLLVNIMLKGEDPYSPLFERWLPPSWEHPLGTEAFGRDCLAIMISGIRNSLIIGFLAGSIATLIGAFIGLFAGYKGGIADSVLKTVTDSILIIPALPIIVALALYLPEVSIFLLATVLAIFGWPRAARTIRAQVASLKERPYIELAKIVGLGDLEIVFREIMPNLFPYIVVGFARSTVGAMFAEAGLAMLGFGPSGTWTLGLFVRFYIQSGVLILGMYHIILPPIVILTTIFTALNLINFGLDEAYNPRLKKVTGR